MSKGLEALKDLRHNLNCMKTGKGFLNVIKDDECLDTIEKELKALEIIINKRLNVDEIYHKDYEWYMLDHRKDDVGLTPSKEEYDLVKEIIDNE